MFRIVRFGSRALGCALVFAAAVIASDGTGAQQFTLRYSFERAKNDGAFPVGGVIADIAGNFYGTTSEGGLLGTGTIFKLSPDGTETVLHSFDASNDGATPIFGVIADQAGNLYGTTESGGGDDCYGQGCGTVFELAPDGRFTILYDFRGGSDGGIPSGLIADQQGNLYGTTQQGGTGCADVEGCGTVFEVAPDGTETVLHEFLGGDDGAAPFASLTADQQGNLYGTTLEGGSKHCGGLGCGTVFKLGPDGAETVLYVFRDGGDGRFPTTGLILDKKGNLYGTTPQGGDANCDCGVLFKVSAEGKETVLHTFMDGTDGAYPSSPLIRDKKGRLFGTSDGGARTYGNLFEIAPDGTETVLHVFTGGKKNGLLPAGNLIQYNGQFVGTTREGGGRRNLGTVYELKK